MALNPIVFTEKVVRSFLRYQLTAYPFADEGLHGLRIPVKPAIALAVPNMAWAFGTGIVADLLIRKAKIKI